MSMNLRKAVLSVAALVLAVGGTTVGISSAQAATAAVKQGVKCAPAKAVKTVSGVKYICMTNPAGTPAGLTWTTQTCVDADTAYKTALKQYNDFTTSQTTTLNAIKATIDSAKHSIDVSKASLAAAQTKLYTVGYDHTVTPTKPITVVGIDAAITAVTAKIAATTAKRDAAGKQRDATALLLAPKYTATQIAGWAASPATTTGNSDVNVLNYGAWIKAYLSYDKAIVSEQKNLATLQRTTSTLQANITKGQTLVDSMTARYNTAIANQPTQAQQIKTASDQALVVRKTGCKAGL